MRKYLFKTVVLLTVAIMLFSNIAVFADGHNWKNDKFKDFKESKEYVKVGTITEINSNVITIGEKSDKNMFKISDKTAILNADNAKIKSSELKKGINVEVTYYKISKDKKDKVNDAISVKIIKDSSQIKNAYIEEIADYSKTEKVVTITYETIDSKNRTIENYMDLIVDANTKIYNQLGDSIKVSSLKQGMLIDAEHSNKITKSFIPQAYALQIKIVKSEADTLITESKILDIYTNGQKLYILVGDANNTAKQILFVLSDNAVIKNQYNKTIAFKDLVKGQKIKVEHSSAMTRSLPPQSVAYSVQLVDDLGILVKENSTIEEISYISNTELLVTIAYETKENNKIIKNKMDLVVDNDTLILDQYDDYITQFDLVEGMVIRAEHSSKITKSYIPQAYTYKISVIKNAQNVKITESNILKKYVLDNELYILVGDANSVSKQILFVLSENVKIRNQYGKTIGFNDLIVGQKIKVEHSSSMSKSLPPQCVAYSIEIVDDYNIEFIDDAIIEEINVKNKNITISYEVIVGKRVYEYSHILVVDSDTIILDKNGKAIALSSLKTGMVIDVEHELLAILSSPPKSYAHKINIVYDNVDEPIYEDDCELFELLIKLYVETDSKEWLNCILYHNHDWSNLNGEELDDLFESMLDNTMDDDDLEDLLENLFKGFRWDD